MDPCSRNVRQARNLISSMRLARGNHHQVHSDHDEVDVRSLHDVEEKHSHPGLPEVDAIQSNREDGGSHDDSNGLAGRSYDYTY